MASFIDLETRLCVAWQTERPLRDQPRGSRDFLLQCSDWCLNLVLNEQNIYHIWLEKKTACNRFRSFNVSTYIESGADRNGPFFWQNITVSKTPQSIWNIAESTLLEVIPELKSCGDLSIVCVFRRVPNSSPEPKKKANLQLGQTSYFNSASPTAVQKGSFGTSMVVNTLYYKVGKRKPSAHKLVQASLDFEPGLLSLSHDLSNLFDSDTFPDVRLKSGDNHSFSAHRAILSARSEVFSAMFRNQMAESQTGTVDVTDVDAPVLDTFLRYMYSGRVPELSEDTVMKLYSVSDKYAVHDLKEACSNWILGGLTERNCLDFLKLADAHCDAAFKDTVVSFIIDNQEVLKSEAWFRFSKEMPNLSIEVYRSCFS